MSSFDHAILPMTGRGTGVKTDNLREAHPRYKSYHRDTFHVFEISYFLTPVRLYGWQVEKGDKR